jgi:hypothetical protein
MLPHCTVLLRFNQQTIHDSTHITLPRARRNGHTLGEGGNNGRADLSTWAIHPHPPDPGQLTCAWVPTGNPRNPLVCVWVESYAPKNSKEASFSNDESGRMLLCA